jgi:hypothetical protein
VVRLRTTRALRVARVALARDDDRVLAEHQMQEVPLVRLARKGSIGERFLTVGAGAHTSGLGPTRQLLGAAGVEWENQHWLPSLELALSAGTQTHEGLETRDLLALLTGQLLYTLRLGTAALRAGPVGGAAYVRQQTAGQGDRASFGFTFGGRARTDLQITPSVGVYVLAEVRGLGVKLVENDGKRFGVEPLYAASAGLRAAF